MDDLKILPQIFLSVTILELPNEQYQALTTIFMYMGRADAPTGVVAQNIGGKTIHSELHIVFTGGGFQTHALTDRELKSHLQKVDTIIIDEISIVSAELLDFVSNLFANLHENSIAFSGINVIVVGDLAQLPPITSQYVFCATVWTLFYPLFLRTSQCQNNDLQFYALLEEVRTSNISNNTWQMLQQKHSQFLIRPIIDIMLNTTHIVGFRENAQ
ncbi:12505_t:CDS:2 [Ambispora leptoticha]|uniref:ATP-dependent DNA helicase n=1 Tax=Ambispora leptoticha TaxID=144679 RepID=A0A9N9FV84_9GLOM|nr:12505_t:CDS:2 [Ambispora leptoticha]